MTIELYCFGESGNAYKAALVLELSGLDWTPRYVDFFGGEARSPQYLENVNVMGEVPVMFDGDLKLVQSGVMQDYIIEKSGKFAPASPADAREVKRWQFWDNHKGSSQFGMTRFQMNFLREDLRSAEVIGFLQGRVKAALKVLDSALDGRDWLVGSTPTAADFSCCAYLFYPEPFGFDRDAYPNIDRWLDGIAALPGWKHPYELMPGSPADRA